MKQSYVNALCRRAEAKRVSRKAELETERFLRREAFRRERELERIQRNIELHKNLRQIELDVNRQFKIYAIATTLAVAIAAALIHGFW